MARRLRVGIVGGSIGGCTAAAELLRAGHDVTIFERSVGALQGRGAGIGTPTPTFDLLVQRDLVGADTPRTRLTIHWLAGIDPSGDAAGRASLELPLDMVTLHWKDLWGELRARIPEDCYLGGSHVTRVVGTDTTTPGLALDDGSQHDFDLVVFADGYTSVGRSRLFPDSTLEYRGYVLWRGLLPESQVADPRPLEDRLYRFSLPRLHGNAVFYFVPGEDGSVAVGERYVNWAHYVPVSPEDLPDFLIDKDGQRHATSLPPGGMRPDAEAELKELLVDHLPPYFAELTSITDGTFAQPIYTYRPTAYRRGRVCLIGDAGSVVPPFTGSGVFKASKNAIDLAAALADAEHLDQALEKWSDTETEAAHRLAALGDQMEQAFVWAAPDLGTMSADEARTWWTDSISFPEDFTYIAAKDHR
jgi:2-polyprenyl-6-methoxyphenol hydroxylase-like FAD-dependent oxidoreductase